MGMDYIQQKGMEVRPEYYQEVYMGALVPGTTLEDLYIQFNGPKMPEDFTGHSLSVSDVVVVHKEGADHAYYVDRFGYEEIPEFLTPIQTQEKDVTVETKKEITTEGTDELPQETGESAKAITSKDAKQSERRKESVLGKLGEKQKQINAERAKPEKQQKQKTQTVKRGKGEQAI